MQSEQNGFDNGIRPVLVTCSVASFDQAPNNGNSQNALYSSQKVNIFRPALASLVVSLASIVNGMALGYPATAIPNLNHAGSFKLDPFQTSWFGSLYFLGAVPGALLSGLAMDRFGRKATIMFSTLPYIFGWITIAGSVNIWMMYSGRLLTGFCFGLILSIIGVYISEISPPKLRGILMSFHELSLNIGALFMYILGTFLPWNWCAVDCALVLATMACGLFFMPETSRWLIMNNEKEQAAKTLQWIRGDGVDISEELKEIEESIKDTLEMTPWRQYIKRPLLKCFLVSEFLYVLQELSGINVVRQYTVTIFETAKISMNPNTATIIVGLLLVLGSVVFTAVVEKRERRIFLLISSLMMALSLAGMGTYLQINIHYPQIAESTLFWLPLISIGATCFGFVLGVGPLPYVVTSEMFPNRARGRASSMGVATLCLSAFLLTKYFVNISAAIGDSGAFFLCALNCLTGFNIIYFTVPETKGKKLEEIQAELEFQKRPE